MTTQNQKGFTLVEIAIVLVIIGLLLGGVLKGQELIASSKIKAEIQNIKNLQAAIYSFQDKYRALPGDYDDAAASIGGADTVDGNGNGTIDGNERGQLFLHLIEAGFISGSSDGTASASGYQKSGLGGSIIVDDGNPFNGELNACIFGLTLDEANEMDRRVDGSPDGTKGDVKRNNSQAYAATNNAVCFKL